MDLLIDKGYYTIYDVLNEHECFTYKKMIDELFNKTPDYDGLEIDGYERMKIRNDELSILITKKLNNYFNISTIDISFYWYPTRYINGGGLSIHSDGSSYDELKSSSYTILIYLNDDFEGGRTVFVDDYDDDEIVDENSEYVSPKQGMILLLNQNKLHFAEKVSNGVKYILRGDIF
jgi:hypothetical protein